jgi:propionyl-CoA carboxylase alpha chain
VLADAHGTVWALGERECSIQRRHQKVIEEAPSPAVDAELRRRLCEAAVAAAHAVGYTGAGTVEFIVSQVRDSSPGAVLQADGAHGEGRAASGAVPATAVAQRGAVQAPQAVTSDVGAGALALDGEFFFLEMNTRLQVEHPVTECVTGLDLVRLQLLVAEGRPLPAGPPARTTGHAIEARLYAEDPAAGWRPDSGVLHRFAVPGVDAEFAVPDRYGLRLDAGVADGSAVGVHYDPMLAKVVAWAPSREEAARRLAAALAGARLHGLVTNRDLLVRVLRHPAFLAGETDTGFLDRHGLAALAEPLAGPAVEALSALAAALAGAAANQAGSRVQPRVPAGWRNVPSQPQRRAFLGPSGRLDAAYRLVRGRLDAPDHPDVTLVSATPDEVVLEAAGVTRTFAVARYPGLVCVDSALGPVTLRPVDRFPAPDRAAAAGSLLAPMPGTVVSVAVAEGDAVRAGQQLLVLEAMKMQHPVAAPAAGTVRRLPVRVGSQVEVGALLAVVAPAEP